MSYYHIDGVSGVFASPDTHVHEQSKSWRLLVASVLFVLSILFSTVAVKVLAGVEQVSLEAPRISGQMSFPQAQSPVVLAASETETELQKELEAWAGPQKAEWSFYVQSLNSGDVLAAVDHEKKYQMASIYKLFLLQPIAKKIPVEAWSSSNVTDKSYLACVQAMLAVSDNPCAEAIAGKLGWQNVHKQVQAAGYKMTILNITDSFVTSAADAALLLDRLYHGDGYDAKTKSISLEAMSRRKGSEAIRKACVDCKVYNKTGDLSGYKHDAAIVEKNGKAYVVIIFSSGSTWQQATEVAGIILNRL